MGKKKAKVQTVDVEQFTVSLTADSGHGSVSGAGTYAAGSEVTIGATPGEGYAFAKWSDGSISPSRTFILTGNVTLTAYWANVVPFGRADCSSIEVDPFRKVCEYPEVSGTTPLTLDVPIPAFVPPMLPNECACFTFESPTPVPTIVECNRTPHCSVEIVQKDTDCCTGRYTVVPHIEIPACTLPDEDPMDSGSFATDGFGSSISWKVKRECCNLSFEFEPHVVTPVIPVPCPLCVKGEDAVVLGEAQAATRILANGTTQTKFSLTAKYNDETQESGEGTATADFIVEETTDPTTGCPCCTFKGDELDLTGIGGGFANGGDVFKDADTKKLWIDGDRDEDEANWYGGGYGNKYEDDFESTFCRGPKMRNRVPTPTALTALYGGNVDITIPYDGSYPYQHLIDEDGNESIRWMSTRTSDFVYPEGTATGNLTFVMPSGLQWHDRGLAMVISQFDFNQSGVLSVVYEKKEALLLAPAPSVTLPTSAHAANLPASGLICWPWDAEDAGQRTTGLSVNAGDGLRIYGIGDGTVDPTDVDATRQGVLETMYGPGIRILNNVDESTKPTEFLNKPVRIPGALIPNEGRGLRVHGFTKMKQAYPNRSQDEATVSARNNELEVHCFPHDLTFQPDGRLVFNDTESGDDYILNDDNTGLNTYSRANDMTFPVVVANDSATNIWASVANGSAPKIAAILAYIEGIDTARGNAETAASKISDASTKTAVEQLALAVQNTALALRKIREFMATIFVTQLHVSKSGIVIGADADYSAESVTRYATAT